MTVYIDEMFAVNGIMDFVLLWCVGHLGKFTYSGKGLFLGALCGGLYAVVIFLPVGYWLAGWGGKVACSAVMVWLAFRPKGFRAWVKAMAYLYGVAFAMGGAVIAAMYFLGQGFTQTWNGIAMVMVDFQLLWLAFGVLAAIVLVCFLRRPLRRDLTASERLVQVNFALAGQAASVRALVDTGNGLSEPLSKRPVVVVEFQTVAHLLPEAVATLYREKVMPAADVLLLAAADTVLANRARIIPFHAVGIEKGALLGFRPDWLIVDDGGRKHKAEAVVAVQNQRLSPYGTYQGLVGPELLSV